MSKTKWLSLALIVMVSSLTMADSVSSGIHPATDAVAGWRLGVQCWSFNRFSFMEAVDKTADLGLSWIEAYPGQEIMKGKPYKFDPSLPAEIRQQIKDKVSESGLKIVNFGVTSLSGDIAKDRVLFEFAKDMGIETIVSEPPYEAFDNIDKLCQEYKINVAVHNHPKPNPYWDPQIVMDHVKGHSKYLGACVDTGHWSVRVSIRWNASKNWKAASRSCT